MRGATAERARSVNGVAALPAFLAGNVDFSGVLLVCGVLLSLLFLISVWALLRSSRRTSHAVLFLGLLDVLLGAAFLLEALDGASALEWCVSVPLLGIGALLVIRGVRA